MVRGEYNTSQIPTSRSSRRMTRRDHNKVNRADIHFTRGHKLIDCRNVLEKHVIASTYHTDSFSGASC